MIHHITEGIFISGVLAGAGAVLVIEGIVIVIWGIFRKRPEQVDEEGYLIK